MRIEVLGSGALAHDTRERIVHLCNEAYEEDLAHYLDDMGPGLHLLGWLDEALVSHVAIVPRWMQPAGHEMMHTAYIELVATAPRFQRRGLASTLIRRAVVESAAYELAALSPSEEPFYARLGWEMWRGPLSVRTSTGLVPTPEEEVMIHRLPRTPPTLDLDLPVSIEWRRGEVW
jgi:aminoglycoside 2'-N-acetyltransferase I